MQIAKILLLFSFFASVYSWRIFFRGRERGGNIGKPHSVGSFVSEIPEEWFTQVLDHFNPVDERTWQQRYYTNVEYYGYNSGGPVFLMIGGEGEASVEWMTNGAWIDYAKQYGALCFQLEHRYYGKSHPTKNLSTKNLQYLTSQQALADLATFIDAMNEKYKLPSDVKWIVFGGSYPGSLAAWMRMKYPFLVHGAMSASGPLLAEVDFADYFKVVEESLATYDQCVDVIKSGTIQIGLYLQNKKWIDALNELFHLCDSIEGSVNNPNDIANLYDTLAGNFAGVVQYNKDNRIGKSAKLKNITIDTVCDIMVNSNHESAIERLAHVNKIILDAYGEKCLDYKYQNLINDLRNTSWESETAEGGRQWTYQTCTEFGFFQTSSYAPQIFGDKFPVDFYIQQCEDIFGPRYNASFLEKGVDRTNNLYGALGIEVTNVVFVHGSIDPWHALGITKTVNQGAPAIYINGTAHCANMYPESDDDLPALKAARVEIAEHIGSWLRL